MEALALAGVPASQSKMRAAQLWNWMYARGAQDIMALTNIAKGLRAELDARFTLARPEIAAEQISEDGTRKWLLRLEPARPGERAPEIETVYIPEPDRGTLCISSQVGCTLTCSFCHTGTQRLVRNLTAAEIVGQILVARDRIGDWPGASAPADGRGIPEAERKITNIVLMGMGEPLYNFENVKAAVALASDPDALSFSKRRITLSTSGVVPMIERAGAEMGVMLAISLHAVRDELARRACAHQPQIPNRGAAGGLPRLSGPVERAAHHLRICHAEGRERFRRRGEGTGAAARGHPGEDQPDPVQPMARLAL